MISLCHQRQLCYTNQDVTLLNGKYCSHHCFDRSQCLILQGQAVQEELLCHKIQVYYVGKDNCAGNPMWVVVLWARFIQALVDWQRLVASTTGPVKNGCMCYRQALNKSGWGAAKYLSLLRSYSTDGNAKWVQSIHEWFYVPSECQELFSSWHGMLSHP